MVNPIIYRALYIPSGARLFPSTVSLPPLQKQRQKAHVIGTSGTWDECTFTYIKMHVNITIKNNGSDPRTLHVWYKLLTWMVDLYGFHVGKYTIHERRMAWVWQTSKIFIRQPTEVQRWDASKHGQDEERQPREETSHAMADSLSRQKYGKKQKEGLYTFMLKDGCYIPGPLLWPSNVTLCTYIYIYT